MSEVQTSPPLARQIAASVYLEKPARALLREDQTALEYIDLLSAEGHFPDAARVLATLLPAREAVWWACQCARQSAPAAPTPEWNGALEAAEKWVAEMTEESRRAAEFQAKETGVSTAPGCAAMAAFMCSGSIAPPESANPVAAPPEVAPQLAAGSIMASALTPNPAEAPEKYRRFLQQGAELYRTTAASPG